MALKEFFMALIVMTLATVFVDSTLVDYSKNPTPKWFYPVMIEEHFPENFMAIPTGKNYVETDLSKPIEVGGLTTETLETTKNPTESTPTSPMTTTIDHEIVDHREKRGVGEYFNQMIDSIKQSFDGGKVLEREYKTTTRPLWRLQFRYDRPYDHNYVYPVAFSPDYLEKPRSFI